MNSTSQYSSPTLRRRAAPPAEVEALLELSDQPRLLVDGEEWLIISASQRALDLTAFTRPELLGAELTRLLPGWKPPAQDETGAEFEWTGTLSGRNRSKTSVTVHCQKLPGKAKWWLLSLIERDGLPLAPLHEADSPPSALLEDLAGLIEALGALSLPAGPHAALAGIAAFTGTTELAVYLARPDAPALLRAASAGSLLPEELPSQDLTILRASQTWAPGKRPVSQLHRISRVAGLAYLATAPLGSPKAAIGLLAAGSVQPDKPADLAERMRFSAALLTALVSQYTQVEELQSASAQKSSANQILETIFQTTAERLVILTPDLRVQRLNPAAEVALGYRSSEVYGVPAESILIATEDLASFIKTPTKGNTIAAVENIRLYRRTGTTFLATLERSAAAAEDGSPLAVVIRINDLSEQEQLNAHAAQLEQRALLGEVTAVFAHEVRNPINNISTGLQLLTMKQAPDDPDRDLIGRIQQDCDRLTELMKSVLAFSRPTEYEMEPVDLGYLVNRLLDRLRPRLAAAKIQPHIQVEAGLPGVNGNPRALEQVFTNLFVNAIQAMSENGGMLAIKIARRAGEPGRDQVEVSIADSGPGISKDVLDRIFNPFFTTRSSGTGLGLAITKRIVTSHRGNIQVASYPGVTVFSVQFPALKSSPPETPAVPARSEGATGL